jgi:hypothetical protein
MKSRTEMWMNAVCLCAVLTMTLQLSAQKTSVPLHSDDPTQGSDATFLRNVFGTQIGHYKDGPVPVDLSATTIAAFVPNGSGGYHRRTGVGTSNGYFAIPKVPSGFYLLQLGSTFLWTKNTLVDADYNADYRSDTVQADQNTTVTFDLTNLNPWQDTDFFEMLCPNNLVFDTFSGTAGQNTLTGTFPYFGSLSVGSEGDQYYLAQLITQNVSGFPFTALGRYIAPAKFTQAQGSDTAINGRLKTIAQNHTFEANINGADLAAQALAANPKAVLVDTTVALDVYPGSLKKGESTAAPDLVIYDVFSEQPLITTDGDLGQVAYGNPYHPKWPLFDIYQWLAQTNYTAPGATNSVPIFTRATGNNITLPTSTNPITPLVGVVSKPSINHKNFFVDRTGVGTTPTLRWSPPSLGTATYYSVQIYQLANNGGNTTRTSIALLYTQQTSLLIPKSVMSAGQAYVFKIHAGYVPGIDFTKTPFMNGPTFGFADVISGMMQP